MTSRLYSYGNRDWKYSHTLPPISVFENTFISTLSNEFLKFRKEFEYLPFSEQDLLRQFYLHFHRLKGEQISTNKLKNEIQRLAENLFKRRSELPIEIRKPVFESINLRKTKFQIVENLLAEMIHETHHYLGNVRKDSINLGLYSDELARKGKLMSLVTLSSFDLNHMMDLLPKEVSPNQVLVLSRYFAFDWCPYNTASFTLGRTFNWLKAKMPHIKMLITYLNPNLGFSGSIYKASNWKLFGIERKERYLYFEENYVTDRKMIDQYGTAKYEKLRDLLGDKISKSNNPIQPLRVYSFYLDEVLRRKHKHEPVYDFNPNKKLV